MKLFQMLLCKREVLERYSTQGLTAASQGLSAVFGELLSLDKTEEGDRNAQLG